MSDAGVTFASFQFAQPYTAQSGSSSGSSKTVQVSGYARVVTEQTLPFHRTIRITGKSKVVRNNLI